MSKRPGEECGREVLRRTRPGGGMCPARVKNGTPIMVLIGMPHVAGRHARGTVKIRPPDDRACPGQGPSCVG